MRVNNYQFLPSHSGATSFVSNAYPLNQVFGFAIQAVITGTLNGTIKLEWSNDPNTQTDPSYAPTNWNTYSNSMQTVSGAGKVGWIVSDIWFTWVRISYTASSGTGNISAIINTKGN